MGEELLHRVVLLVVNVLVEVVRVLKVAVKQLLVISMVVVVMVLTGERQQLAVVEPQEERGKLEQLEVEKELLVGEEEVMKVVVLQGDGAAMNHNFQIVGCVTVLLVKVTLGLTFLVIAHWLLEGRSSEAS